MFEKIKRINVFVFETGDKIIVTGKDGNSYINEGYRTCIEIDEMYLNLSLLGFFNPSEWTRIT